jgi:hypothetical protein
MKNYNFLILALIFVLNSCSKPNGIEDTDAYKADKAYYENYLNPYTRADGSCVDGCTKVNGECVLDANTFKPAEYGEKRFLDTFTPSLYPAGTGWNVYWKRDFKDTPDAFPQYFYINFADKRNVTTTSYDLNQQFHEVYSAKNVTLPSGYTVKSRYIYDSKVYSYYIKVDKRPQGDTFNTVSFPEDRIVDGKEVRGYMHGSFSKDYKYMTYYWRYEIRKNPPGEPGIYETYKITKPVTLEYH